MKDISGGLLIWTSSFISNHTQRVIYRGATSSSTAVLAGVPQGSVLGPTLFTIYIDSVTRNLNCIPFLYADDITLLQPIHRPADYTSLQADLDVCHRWTEEHQLPVNTAKSCTMTFTGPCRPREIPVLTFGGREIRRVISTTVLGVELDSRLSFAPHVHRTVARSRRMLGFVTRSTVGMPPRRLDSCTLP
ncbi:hypothetical protein HPB48_015821 [Haemaphysalis longicornis]|uniref:Reverse transcriptase domain-containing protein n=1 Tax=Haemaphysalis longicornis TaxID=44386 RepID=A0A9J6FB95_HAELO|nr:hypothetical protein HPB48_015821 [Haemaphysalis longicornis]